MDLDVALKTLVPTIQDVPVAMETHSLPSRLSVDESEAMVLRQNASVMFSAAFFSGNLYT